jgi:hypothetical protein
MQAVQVQLVFTPKNQFCFIRNGHKPLRPHNRRDLEPSTPLRYLYILPNVIKQVPLLLILPLPCLQAAHRRVQKSQRLCSFRRILQVPVTDPRRQMSTSLPLFSKLQLYALVLRTGTVDDQLHSSDG